MKRLTLNLTRYVPYHLKTYSGGNMIDYGIVFGGRYAINEQMSLVGTYYFGLAEATDDISDKHQGFQINISYALQ